MKSVLHKQLKLSDRELDAVVFPDSSGVRRLDGLMRG